MTDTAAAMQGDAGMTAGADDGRVEALDRADQSPPVRSRAPAMSKSTYLSAGCVAIAGAWAFWPLGASQDPALPSSLPLVEPDKFPSSPAAAHQPLQLAAFQVPLWVAPIPPPAPPAPPPPPPPLKLQLIAITSGPPEHPEARGALIFDPDQNKLLTVSVGDRIGSRTILRITDAMVELDDAQSPRQLSLRGERPDASPSRRTPP